MPYITSTNSTGGTFEGYRQISDQLPERPDGMVVRYAGTSDDGLAITVVWETKAHADRFFEDHLWPALQAVSGEAPEPPAASISFDAMEVVS